MGDALRRRMVAEPRDGGAALVEFLGVTVLLLVPVVYLVIALGQIQAATYAVEGASRAAARAAVLAGYEAQELGRTDAQAAAAGRQRADAVVAMALEDFGVRGSSSTSMSCTHEPCHAPGAEVSLTVSIEVPLPGVPGPVVDAIPLAVDVSSTGRASVDGVMP